MLQRRVEDKTIQPDNTGGVAVPGRPASLAARALRLLLKALLPLIVIALGVASYLALVSTRPEVARRAVAETVWPVRTTAVTTSSHQPLLQLYGETMAGRRVELRALVAGEIIETGANLHDGAQVAKGARLILIDPFQYRGALDEAEAQLGEARAKLQEIEVAIGLERDALTRARERLALAQRDVERALPLSKTGAVSRKTLDDRRVVVSERAALVDERQNNLRIQQARAEQQKAAILRLEWGVRLARRNLDNTVLKAPFDAYVSDPNAELGKYVNVNDQIATLLDRHWLDVRFTLSDAQYGRIIHKEGGVIDRDVEVRWHVGSTPLVYRARIERVGAEIASATGGINVYARIRDPEHPSPIRAGAFVEVLVPDIRYEQAVRLPETALYGDSRVYVVKDGRLEERTVELVGVAEGAVLVRGDLAEGERVMHTRLSTPGTGVRVQER